jgi:hypothetical protein
VALGAALGRRTDRWAGRRRARATGGDDPERNAGRVDPAAAEHLCALFFIPEADFPKLQLGDKVAFACDGCRSGLTGKVSYISPQAEYTPPVIYSETTRAKLVFRIEARPPPDEAARFNPGQPVEVRPYAQEQSR